MQTVGRDGTLGAVGTPGAAKSAAELNQVHMSAICARRGDDSCHYFMCFNAAAPGREKTKPFGNAKDVRIYHKSRFAEGEKQDQTCCFNTHTLD